MTSKITFIQTSCRQTRVNESSFSPRKPGFLHLSMMHEMQQNTLTLMQHDLRLTHTLEQPRTHKWNSTQPDVRAIYWAKWEVASRQSRQLYEAFPLSSGALRKPASSCRISSSTSSTKPIPSGHWTTFLMCFFNLYLKMLRWMWWRRRHQRDSVE